MSADHPDRELDACRASHTALVGHLRSLDDVDPAAPSRLPGWSVGHVLTHLARNADSHISMLAGHAQYPHGREGRDADIEVGAGRSWPVLVDDVADTIAALEARWDDVDNWGGTAATIGGQRPVAQLPFLRQREVEIHRVDLDLGYRFADLPSEYVRRELRLMDMLWKARQPMGMTPLPDAVLVRPPHERLAWLTGRLDIDDLPPAGLL